MLDTVAQYWFQKEPGELLRYTQAMDAGSVKKDFMWRVGSLFCQKGRIDDAIALADQMPFSKARTNLLGDIGVNFVTQNAEAAVVWASKLPLTEDVEHVQRAMYTSALGSNDAHAVLAVTPLLPESDKSVAYYEIGRILGKNGVSSALNDIATYAQNLRDQDRDRMIAGIVNTVPTTELQEFYTRAKDIQDKTARGELVSGYVIRLFDQNPQTALEYLNSAPLDVRPNAVRALTMHWYDNDSVALSDWILKLPTGADKDMALATLSKKLASSDRQAAREMAAQIADPKTRDSVIKQVR